MKGYGNSPEKHTESVKPPAPPLPPPEFLDKTIRKIFLCCNKLHELRSEHRRIAELVTWGLSLIISLSFSSRISHSFVDPLAHHFNLSLDAEYKSEAINVITDGVIAALSYLVLRCFIPFFLVAQRAIATHTMGLVGASVAPGAIQQFLSWYIRPEIHPAAERIRIICISGERLFGSRETDEDRPLRDWARRGKLDVVMPVSCTDNPTISERARRYCDDLKRERYRDANDLVSEIDKGKDFLHHYGNIVTEHDVLCMWRVVILQNYCLVQNYFPNIDGQFSDDAPTWVYQNTGKYSYYQTYLEMFELIKRHSGVRHLPERPPSAASSHQN